MLLICFFLPGLWQHVTVSSLTEVAARVIERPFPPQTWLSWRVRAGFRLSAATCRAHASAEHSRGAAARPAAVRGAGAVLHQPLERLHGGAALPCHHTVGPAARWRLTAYLLQKSQPEIHKSSKSAAGQSQHLRCRSDVHSVVKGHLGAPVAACLQEV